MRIAVIVLAVVMPATAHAEIHGDVLGLATLGSPSGMGIGARIGGGIDEVGVSLGLDWSWPRVDAANSSFPGGGDQRDIRRGRLLGSLVLPFRFDGSLLEVRLGGGAVAYFEHFLTGGSDIRDPEHTEVAVGWQVAAGATYVVHAGTVDVGVDAGLARGRDVDQMMSPATELDLALVVRWGAR